MDLKEDGTVQTGLLCFRTLSNDLQVQKTNGNSQLADRLFKWVSKEPINKLLNFLCPTH